jgi:hypothetical protein
MNIGSFVLILSVILLLGILAGMGVFLFYVLRLSINYVAYRNELRRIGKYQEWVIQHKGLVTFEKISFYANFVFILAIIVLGVSERFWNNPISIHRPGIFLNVLVNTSAALVYLFFPYVLVSLFILSRLYKKVPKNWRQTS